jgi:hypothetical protein
MRLYREQFGGVAGSNGQSFSIGAIGERNQASRHSLCRRRYHDTAPKLFDHVRNPHSRADQHWNACAKRLDRSDTKALICRRNGKHIHLLQKAPPLIPRQEAEPSNTVLYVEFARSLVKRSDI